jgi:hypothetical protein
MKAASNRGRTFMAPIGSYQPLPKAVNGLVDCLSGSCEVLQHQSLVDIQRCAHTPG